MTELVAVIAAAAVTVAGVAWWAFRHAAGLRAEATRQTLNLSERNQALEQRTQELYQALQALRAADADLARSARMAAMATLARGVAHELMNPVGFLAGNVAPLRRYCEFLAGAVTKLADGQARTGDEIDAMTRLGQMDLASVVGDLERLLADVDEGARRARLIVEDLQSLTGGTVRRGLERIHLAQVVSRTIRLLGRAADGKQVVQELGEVPPLSARAGELEQVVVNLVDNALRAIKKGGTVTVRLSGDHELTTLVVKDDGIGMPPHVRERACEPFFTTRVAGEGNGLGLAIVAAIIEGHKGTLDIRSAPHAGTEVTVRLPRDGIKVAEGESSLERMALASSRLRLPR